MGCTKNSNVCDRKGESRERQVSEKLSWGWDDGEHSAMKDYPKSNPGVLLDLIEAFMSEKQCKENVLK